MRRRGEERQEGVAVVGIVRQDVEDEADWDPN